jgi:glutathione reductase (NADPH)
MRGFDQDLREVLADEMRNKGINLVFNNHVTEIEKIKDQYKVSFSKEATKYADLVMYATGRTPNTGNIGLENVNVKLNKNGAVIVDDYYQTSVSSIYAIGDVTDRVNLTPVALAEGMVLARHLFGKENKTVDYSDIPTCVFSQPNLSTVGLTEEQARDKYAEVAIYKSKFKPMKLSFTDSDERTFIKLIVDKESDRVVGVHMVGSDAGEIIQGIGIALKAGATKATFDATIGIHPTTAEEFVTLRTPAD